ncbi:MAG: hypothetical protein E6K19_09290 [Methanobacteriota archaeon]|nr:MAG: hypothetical protein E6K19_09290 [Euryarchaeota archaeon]
MRAFPILASGRDMPIWRDRGFDMGKFRERLTKIRIDWSLETTPGIYFAVTIFGALVFTSVAFSLAVFGYLGTVGSFDGSAVCFVATLLPPFVVFVLWIRYRAKWFRVNFPSFR